MQKRIYILSALVLALSVWAVALWLLPFGGYKKEAPSETRYGVSEGMQLVEQGMPGGNRQWVVQNADGDILFRIPLRGCLIDTRYRHGRLAFRQGATGREGYIDRRGNVFFNAAGPGAAVPEDHMTRIAPPPATATGAAPAGTTPPQAAATPRAARGGEPLPAADLRTMAQGNPFYAEAAKILKGRLSEADAAHRRQILNYCEHLRTAYTTKDIDFLRQVFSDDALIIVGNVVKTAKATGHVQADSRVTYALHTKHDYLARLARVFAANGQVDVRFSDFRIQRHPSRNGIYGVSLRQRYRSSRYADDGWLFLLWDFRNPSMPLIHVRTWQPAATVEGSDGVTDISDFSLE